MLKQSSRAKKNSIEFVTSDVVKFSSAKHKAQFLYCESYHSDALTLTSRWRCQLVRTSTFIRVKAHEIADAEAKLQPLHKCEIQLRPAAVASAIHHHGSLTHHTFRRWQPLKTKLQQQPLC
jgi:hypothetical protein